jgi:hypothetical protein
MTSGGRKASSSSPLAFPTELGEPLAFGESFNLRRMVKKRCKESQRLSVKKEQRDEGAGGRQEGGTYATQLLLLYRLWDLLGLSLIIEGSLLKGRMVCSETACEERNARRVPNQYWGPPLFGHTERIQGQGARAWVETGRPGRMGGTKGEGLRV